MRILVTGGPGFIGSHVVDRLLAAGHRPRIFDMRPSPYPLDARRRDRAAATCSTRGAVRARRRGLRRDRAPRRLGRRRDRGQGAARRRGAQRPRHAERARGRARDGRRACSTRRRSGPTPTSAPTRSTRTPASRCPSHLYTATKVAGEMYCRSYEELYGVPSTILRFGIPYGPRARPAAVAADLRDQGAGRRAADDRRRRLAVAALRLRRGPRRRRRGRAAPGGRGPRLQPRRRRGRVGPADRRRRARRRSATSRSCTPRAGRATSPARRVSGAPRRRRARLDARRPRSPRACAATSLAPRARCGDRRGPRRHSARPPPPVPPGPGGRGAVAGRVRRARRLHRPGLRRRRRVDRAHGRQGGDGRHRVAASPCCAPSLARPLPGRVAWSAGAIALLPLVVPDVAEGLHVARLDVVLLVMGAAGAGLVLAVLDGGRRAVAPAGALAGRGVGGLRPGRPADRARPRGPADGGPPRRWPARSPVPSSGRRRGAAPRRPARGRRRSGP